MKVIFDLPDATAARLNMGAVRRGRSIVIPCPLHPAQVPDPSFIADPAHPEIVAPLIDNPVTPGQFVVGLIDALCNMIVDDDIDSQADSAKQSAMESHNAAEEIARQAAVAAGKAAVDRTFSVTFG